MFEKDSIVDEFTISAGGEFHLNEEMSLEDIIREGMTAIAFNIFIGILLILIKMGI